VFEHHRPPSTVREEARVVRARHAQGVYRSATTFPSRPARHVHHSQHNSTNWMIPYPQCDSVPAASARGVIVISAHSSWRSPTVKAKYWEASVHLRPNGSLPLNLSALHPHDRGSNRALATVFDYVRSREGWWAVLEDDAVLLPGCDYSALPLPIPPRCWYISMDYRGYAFAPTVPLNDLYDRSGSGNGYGTAGFFIHSTAAAHYLAKHRDNVSEPFDLLVHASNWWDPVARGRVCFMRAPGPRVAHNGSRAASIRLSMSTDGGTEHTARRSARQ